ncbi:hypothetical protein [Aeromicrobium sp. 9AM]|uniref:hypothetical protein n=1 Tax=Aeromicrobium sp. 9AM TaxID=2653126 RepID=UPI00135A7184|nr:hypothetical protein [Aeromicrobium sp. 9AM]
MSAFDELQQTGMAGEQTFEMLLGVTRQTVKARNYPAPDGKAFWDQDDLAELAHEMVLACSDGQSFVDTVLAASTDDDSLRAVVAHRVGVAFAERARDTDTGHLVGRIRKLLRANTTDFNEVRPSFWSPAGAGVTTEADTSREDLLRAAFAVPGVKLTRWNAEAERRSPFASKADLERLVLAILRAAGAPVHERELIKVLADYFGLRPNSVDIDDVTDFSFQDDGQSPAQEVENSQYADMIWEQLTADERTVLPWLDDSVTDMADGLGIGRTRAHNIRASARVVVARALGIDAEGNAQHVTVGDAFVIVQMLQERAADAASADGEA